MDRVDRNRCSHCGAWGVNKRTCPARHVTLGEGWRDICREEHEALANEKICRPSVARRRSIANDESGNDAWGSLRPETPNQELPEITEPVVDKLTVLLREIRAALNRYLN